MEYEHIFAYNADGMRISRTVGETGTTYSYVYDGNKLSQMKAGNVTLRFTYDTDGTPLTLIYNGEAYYYAVNLQGDVVAILDGSGAKIVSYTYDAWGNIIASTDTSGVSIGTKNPFRYRGYYYDTETGLYYLNSRYYDPQVGRFLNADGLVSTGQGLLGSNMFAYCGNNPVMFSDSSGLAQVGILERNKNMASAGGEMLFLIPAAIGILGALGDELSSAWDSLSDTVADATSTVKEAVEERYESREHYVYVLKDDQEEVQYVGRTISPVEREQAHKKDKYRKDLHMEIVARNLTLNEARALEEAGMIYFHTIHRDREYKRNNQINGVAPKFWERFKVYAKGTLDYADNKLTDAILCWTEG